jgi:hypothetical protein
METKEKEAIDDCSEQHLAVSRLGYHCTNCGEVFVDQLAFLQHLLLLKSQ